MYVPCTLTLFKDRNEIRTVLFALKVNRVSYHQWLSIIVRGCNFVSAKKPLKLNSFVTSDRIMEESFSLEVPVRTERTVWAETVLYVVMNVAAFFGNLSVCYAVYRNQRLRTLANMFVVALAVSDILISICCMPFSVATLFRGRWIFGASFCRFQGFAMFTCGMASLNTMGIIAISRYFCVVRPQKYIVLFNKQRISMYICLVWCAALVGSVPPLLFKNGGYKFQPAKAMCM